MTLISLDQRMQEIAHSKTDDKGHFTIEAPDPGMHLIRVDHQGAAYFQPAPPNTPNVNVQVYDVAATVEGVNTVANVMRVETDPQGLRVTQSFFIKNDSTPPRTQFSSHSYDFYLPADAQIEGSAAMAPGGMPVQSSPVPLSDKGHYAFLFPLRPGVTQFQLSYHLPYSGSLAFDQKFATATDSFVVMMPKSMSFKAGGGAQFQSLNETPGATTMLARNTWPFEANQLYCVWFWGYAARYPGGGPQGNDGGQARGCRWQCSGKRHASWRWLGRAHRYAGPAGEIQVVDSGRNYAGVCSRGRDHAAAETGRCGGGCCARCSCGRRRWLVGCVERRAVHA